MSEMQLLHEEILLTSREKKGRGFLENPEWGVGFTTTRGRLPMPYWCQFCRTGDYTCLGGACMGPRLSASSVNVCCDEFSRLENCRIPGLFFKDSSSVHARLPEMKRMGHTSAASRYLRSLPIMRTVRKIKNFSGVWRHREIPSATACCDSKRRVKHKVYFQILFES